VSRLFPERIEVGLYPDRVVVGAKTVPITPGDAAAPRWQPALDALSGEQGLKRARITVVLSGFFVRYALVPLNAALSGAAERLALARHCLARTYGAALEGWPLRLSGEVACAVDPALVEALAGRCRSLQPRLMASFNRHRRRIGRRAAWFVDVEPGLASLALIADGRWQSLRALRVGENWHAELPALIAREACFVDTPADCLEVVHAGP
jgi:hypothetical protein